MTAGPPSQPFIVVVDWQDIYARGAEFSRCEISAGLRLCTWPPYMVLRDTMDDARYAVVKVAANGRRGEYQRLESLDGYVWLEPTYNTHLQRVYAPARYVVLSHRDKYHVARCDYVTLCGWHIGDAPLLREPPAGLRECRNCAANTWRCVP